MTKPPLATAISSLLVASIIFTPTLAHAAGGAVSAAEREIIRKQNYVIRGEQMIESGDLALKARDYERATAAYKQACDFVPNATQTKRSYDRALRGFCEASCKLAEQRIAEGRYADAENILKIVIDDRYNPACKEAIRILAHLEEPGYYVKTSGPEFIAKVEKVKQLFIEAEGFYQTDRYDLAFKRCEQILNLDPYNKAARMMEEKISKARSDFNVVSYTEKRARAMEEVDRAWRSPVRKFNVLPETIPVADDTKAPSNIAKIQKKLEKTIIPKLDFKDATIREAVEFLKRKSVELDPIDEPRTGVNIVLKLEAGPSVGIPDVAVPAPAPAGIPGLDPVAPPAAPAAPVAPVGGGNAADTRITVALANIPLIEALRYVTGLANLKFKVEPFAVSIVPLSVSTDVLITKEWKVRPDLIPRTPTAPGAGGAGGFGGGAGAAGAPGDASKGGSGIADRESAKNWLISSGAQFNGQASAVYIVASSRLIVRNTQEQLDLIDSIITQGTGTGGPTQVEIEAKFVEISQNNLKELSFDWTLGQFNAPANKNVFLGGGTSGNAGVLNPVDFPFVAPGPTIVGSNPLTGGNRSGGTAISSSAVDALLFGATGSTSKLAPAIGAIAGVFTDPQFQVVIRALNQKKGVDLLSSPRVTTKSGQRAVIEIIREFKYPTEFDPPQIPQTFGGNNGGVNLVGAPQAQNNSFPVTPTTPTAFEVRNTGVTLEVEPVVGPDGYTIDLNLVPQVVEFEGFINYGSPIQTTSTNPITGITSTQILTANTINQPVFSTRKVTTSVSVYDGNTVVIGGLMREDVQKVEDKVPLLGDIPIVGRLFRSSVDQHTKRNLVIFVSARLMKPDGDPVRLDEEKEEVVETLATPELSIPELPLMSK
ncbi:MAG: type II and III secretion system protein [Chthoniobacter sp.]|nr:type II and III secretion system protein [Chthoniobacter sp.]